MEPLLATPSPPLSVSLQGLALSLGLIVAIGAQNAFVLRQGLRREHVGSVVLFCAVMDALLIAAGVLGMAQALGDRPGLARALALAALQVNALDSAALEVLAPGGLPPGDIPVRCLALRAPIEAGVLRLATFSLDGGLGSLDRKSVV